MRANTASQERTAIIRSSREVAGIPRPKLRVVRQASKTLQLGELQVQGTEVPVGNFFIDILARDIDDRVIVIENQFGPTDIHTSARS
jgi:hypothetical protein